MNPADSPGFRRRIIILPEQCRVTAALEDDIHCMAVTLQHDGDVIAGVTSEMERWPWLNCPGAMAVLERTFIGMPIRSADPRASKKLNCTHLYDLAELAVSHASDRGSTVYDIAVSDPVARRNRAELWLNGEPRLAFDLFDDVVQSPEAAKGLHLLHLREWTTSLSGDEREWARILQWVSLISHSRQMDWTLGEIPDPQMAPSCFNYQPESRQTTRRVGPRYDFSQGGREPLSFFDGKTFRT